MRFFSTMRQLKHSTPSLAKDHLMFWRPWTWFNQHTGFRIQSAKFKKNRHVLLLALSVCQHFITKPLLSDREVKGSSLMLYVNATKSWLYGLKSPNLVSLGWLLNKTAWKTGLCAGHCIHACIWLAFRTSWRKMYSGCSCRWLIKIMFARMHQNLNYKVCFEYISTFLE